MRIATTQIYDLNIAALQAKQNRLGQLQQQLASGRRLLVPSDDPTGTRRALQLSQHLGQTRSFLDNMQSGETRLKSAGVSMDAARGVLDRARATAMGMQMQTSMSQRSDAANYLSQLRESLLGYANSKDSNGDYLFAGSLGGSAPFVETGGVVAYNGNGYQRQVAIGEARQVAVADPGDRVFSMEPGNPNDPFDAIADLVNDLNNAGLTGAAYGTAVANGLARLEGALARIDTVRGEVAHRLTVIAAAKETANGLRRAMQDELQKIEGVDMQRLAVELQLQQVSLQASQQAFVKTSQLSLFNYL